MKRKFLSITKAKSLHQSIDFFLNASPENSELNSGAWDLLDDDGEIHPKSKEFTSALKEYLRCKKIIAEILEQ